jgi:hypothetical protein
MPILKFHSISEAEQSKWLQPGTTEFSRALRAVFWMAAKFAQSRPRRPGVFKFRDNDEAYAWKQSWAKSTDR